MIKRLILRWLFPLDAEQRRGLEMATLAIAHEVVKANHEHR